MQFDIVDLGRGMEECSGISFFGNDAQELVKEVKERIKTDFDNARGLQGDFEYNPSTELIEGSSTFLGILANSILEAQAQKRWLPTIRGGIALDKLGRVSNGVYREWGMAVYSGGEPNSEIAENLMKKGYPLPILASFRDLRLRKARNKHGLEVVFIDEPRELITGEEAQKFLEENRFYTDNSGARRVIRDRYAKRSAIWSPLSYSYWRGRVDFVCAEGTRKGF